MITPFTANDFNEYLNMSRDFYNSDATHQTVPEEHFHRTFEEIISVSPLAKGWMVLDEAETHTPAGYLLASLTWSNEFGGRIAWLEELYVKHNFRGRGLGRQALELAMEDLGHAGGAKGFRLEVAPANDGVSELYRRLGFAKVPYHQWWQEV